MWGAVIGDLSGSIYEYSQTTGITTIDNKNILISPNSFYSDDTILTIAILDAYLNDKDYSKYLKLYTRLYKDYQPNFHPYFKTSFSPGFLKWANDKKEGISTGNGALMRISPVAYLADSLETLVKETRKATLPSHNSEEALTTTDLLARIIFLARHNTPKEDILKEFNIQLNMYHLPSLILHAIQLLVTAYMQHSHQIVMKKQLVKSSPMGEILIPTLV